MPSSPQDLRRFLQTAALPLTLGSTLALGAARAQAPQNPPAPAPAPIVRVRPRPQTTVPPDASPDAAPLVTRPVRPRPVNPQALSGAYPSTGQTAAQPIHPHPAPANPVTAPTAAPAHTAAPGASTPSSNAQTTAPPAPPKLSPVLNRTYIVLDPAHGGTDSGSRIGDNTLEKNVTLALAFRLRSLLAARGFTVVLTRDSDAATNANAPPSPNNAPLTLDDRAGIANHPRAAACVLLHATGRGNGVHLYTSELDAAPEEAASLPWLTAQAAWVPASQQLSFALASALGRSHIPLVSSAASVRPVDSLTCPAVVLELAPETADAHSIDDAGYQERVASAIAGALVFWQNQVQPPMKPLFSTPPTTHAHRHPTPAVPPAPEPQP